MVRRSTSWSGRDSTPARSAGTSSSPRRRRGTRSGTSLGSRCARCCTAPFGGDALAGALIATGEADVLVFFWEPLEVQPHDVDVKALLRLAVLHNVPTACNRATADYLISSPLFGT